ncbi:MAG: protein kinase [Deltaproteobacteria bacterium]|nr:protein kinase [Deltaproteobacteria bacterium]
MKVVPRVESRASFLGTGTIIAGKYRIESAIAKGGMGEVWIATNVILDSKVAIKVLLRSLVDSTEAAERLLREARAAARISHRNIVQVYDFGYIETGEPFIVMELLRGENLSDRLVRAVRLQAVQAVEIIIPITHALATAHAKGIIHRDLKPGNIYLAVDESNIETPKIVDFGIAMMASTKYQPRVTQNGNVLGSPEYLSPEQALGEHDIDARADVWALSVTLYESITGRLPFEDESYNRVLRKIVDDPPTPTTEFAAGDSELWAIIEKGLAKKREDRWQTVAAMGAALEGWLAPRGGLTSSGSFRREIITASNAALVLGESDIATETPEPPPKPAELPQTALPAPSKRRPWLIALLIALPVLLLVVVFAVVLLRAPKSASVGAANDVGPPKALPTQPEVTPSVSPAPATASAPAPSQTTAAVASGGSTPPAKVKTVVAPATAHTASAGPATPKTGAPPAKVPSPSTDDDMYGNRR